MHAHVFVCVIHRIITPIIIPMVYVLIIPMYNVHPYFSLKNLGKKVRIIHSKIWFVSACIHVSTSCAHTCSS